MLNAVTIEGIVTRRDTRLHVARLAVYRDGNKRFREDGREMPDFISVRYPPGRSGDMDEGNRVVVHGFLQSREFREPLTRAMKRAGVDVDVGQGKADKAYIPRVATEVVAEKIIMVTGKNGNGEQH